MARLIQFEGRSISVPDDASDDEVAGILNAQSAPAPAAPAPAAPVTDAPVKITVTKPAPSIAHQVASGFQGVGAGVRDIALAPLDLINAGINAGTSGVNKVFGTEIPQLGSPTAIAAKAVEPFSIPESDMSPGERLGYNMNRFGTQAVGTGAMLAARAPAVAAQAMPSEGFFSRILDNLARPYIKAPVRTGAGDAISGAGMGAGATAAEELNKSDFGPIDPRVKPAIDFLAPLLGGVGATTLAGTIEGAGRAAGNAVNRYRADTNVPMNPETSVPYSRSDTERAARNFQSLPVGSPKAVAQDIRENATDLTQPKLPGETPVEPSQLPTTGLLSRDPGMVTAETGARTRGGPEFVQRDQNVKQAAAERVESLKDPNANQGAVTDAAQSEANNRLHQVEQRVQQLEGVARQLEQTRQREGAQFGAIADSEAKAHASQRLDRAVVDEGYVPARTEKNRQFETAPGRHDQLPADDVFAAIDHIHARANDMAPGTLPTDFMRRLNALRPHMIDDPAAPYPGMAEINVGGPGTAAGGDLADLRKFIGAAEQRAQQSGNFDLADNLRSLRSSINRTIEDAPGYGAANANYRNFAERYRPNPTDEGAKFTREIDRGGNDPLTRQPNRGNTPPTETARRFLSSPEKAQSLQRMLDGAPNAQAGQAAIRDYMRSDFASSVLNADGTINPARASAWARNNADVLAQFPAIRNEFDNVVQQAQRGQDLTTDTRAFLDQARRQQNLTQGEIDRGAVGTLLREDPRDVASSILGGKYGNRLDEINRIVRNDPEAARGWKAAVAEVLSDRVTSTRKIGETNEVQYARLAKEFKDNEAVLAKVFSPEEMNTLRQGHKLLEFFKESEKRATIGSNTADKMSIPGSVQLAVRHLYGDLRGGGLIRRFKLLLELLPTNKQRADEIVRMAWFNPNVAAYLLERKVSDPNVPQYNINLRRLMAVDNAARGGTEN